MRDHILYIKCNIIVCFMQRSHKIFKIFEQNSRNFKNISKNLAYDRLKIYEIL